MLITLLIGVVLGAAWALGVIFSMCEVESKENGHERRQVVTALCNRIFALRAENAQMRVSIAAVNEAIEESESRAA